jgi:hypothetical protein
MKPAVRALASQLRIRCSLSSLPNPPVLGSSAPPPAPRAGHAGPARFEHSCLRPVRGRRARLPGHSPGRRQFRAPTTSAQQPPDRHRRTDDDRDQQSRTPGRFPARTADAGDMAERRRARPARLVPHPAMFAL